MASKPRMTQREQARELGISQTQVCRYRQEGMPADVPAARAWLAQHVNPRVKSDLDRQGQLRRRDQEQEVEEDRPMDLGDAFVNCAIFAQRDLERYTPILLHLWWLLAICDDQLQHVEAEGEVPQAVWHAIEAAVSEAQSQE